MERSPLHASPFLVGWAGSDARDSNAVRSRRSRVSGRCRRLVLVPGAGAVYTHRLGVVTYAVFVFACTVVSRDVPLTAHFIVNVIAKLRRATSNASTHAEHVFREEACPFVVLRIGTKTVAKYKTAGWVTDTSSTAVIKLSSLIIRSEVELREVSSTSDLNIVRCLDEVDSVESSIRNNASTTIRCSTPCHGFMFGLADSAVRMGRCPETKVLSGVQPCSLAVGLLVGGGAALICTVLAFLGFVRELTREVAYVPDLIGVTVVARPHVRLGPRIDVSPSEVETLVMLPPGD